MKKKTDQQRKSSRFQITFLGYLLIIGVLASSCRTSKQNNSYQLNEKEVSRALNLPITKRDNLHLYREAALWLNTPHRDGGSSKSGIDCSYLAYIIYKDVYNKQIERNSNDILKKNCDKIGKYRLQEGDLVFFNTLNKGRSGVSHVGVYLKDGKFIHASTSKGVMVNDLDEDYYKKTWVCAGRVR
jgi:probable lipoprotein NlpC